MSIESFETEATIVSVPLPVAVATAPAPWDATYASEWLKRRLTVSGKSERGTWRVMGLDSRGHILA